MQASYLSLYESGELERRAAAARAILGECRLCPRDCGVNRLDGETGVCGVGRRARVASYNAHFGEETPLVGEHGSGTIFFSGCNLGCRFCQNHDISMNAASGLAAAPDELAGVMLELQQQGCHNINFVTPSHVVAHILEALPIAAAHGLTLPLVYNTGGYDAPETLALLDGVVDIYMPDIKMWDPPTAKHYLRAGDYPRIARSAVRVMHHQTGDLVVNEQGVAERGLLVRHLVMPDDVTGIGEWMRFLAGLSMDTYLNIMDQYHPCHEAHQLPGIDRAATQGEVYAAKNEAKRHGLHRLDERDERFFYRFLEKTR